MTADQAVAASSSANSTTARSRKARWGDSSQENATATSARPRRKAPRIQLPARRKPCCRRRRRVAGERLERRDRHAQEHEQQAGQTGRGAENRRDDLHFLKVAKASEGGYSRPMRLGKDGKVELIRKVPLFSKLSKKGLEEVAHIADELDLPKGKVMAEEGDRGREFFVLLEGEADVTKGEKSINTMHEGDFFGEIALVTKMPRTASVTATTDVRVLVITERDFGALLKHSAEDRPRSRGGAGRARRSRATGLVGRKQAGLRGLEARDDGFAGAEREPLRGSRGDLRREERKPDADPISHLNERDDLAAEVVQGRIVGGNAGQRHVPRVDHERRTAPGLVGRVHNPFRVQVEPRQPVRSALGDSVEDVGAGELGHERICGRPRSSAGAPSCRRRPSTRTPTRSASAAASSKSWVTSSAGSSSSRSRSCSSARTFPRCAIERGHRLVEEEHSRFPSERARERDTLAFAPGQLDGFAFAKMLDVQAAQEPVRARTAEG